MNYHLSFKSGNKKTGPIPVSTSSPDTCPNACPLKRNGCYADSGPLRMHWDKVASKTETDIDAFCGKIASLPAGTLWRHNQAGDLPGINNKIDDKQLNKIIASNIGKRGFTYTHKPATKHNLTQIKRANYFGFMINLSANNLDHADYLLSLKVAPVVTILPGNTTNKVNFTPNGAKVITCPATYNDKVNCKSCGLCAKNRDYVIGFPVHGTSSKKAEVIAQQTN